jgi:hypothetical protein
MQDARLYHSAQLSNFCSFLENESPLLHFFRLTACGIDRYTHSHPSHRIQRYRPIATMSASLFLVRNRFASSSRLVATTLRYSSTSASTPSADAPAVVKPADSAVATHQEQNNNIQAGVINGMPGKSSPPSSYYRYSN